MQFTDAHAGMANDMLRKGTLVEHLGISFRVNEEGRLQATMPVDERTRQPLGMLHGGATAALAETLGSVGSALLVFEEGKVAMGLEVTANHLKPVREGVVTATGELVHKGRSTHVWDIRVRDGQDRLVAVCRLTNMIVDRR
jgi:uncharacterized protein (TIGR00369 family)